MHFIEWFQREDNIIQKQNIEKQQVSKITISVITMITTNEG